MAWNASSGATSYDVYFGTSTAPPLATNTTDITYTPGALASGTTYYWAIGARNRLGANASEAWSFTTSCVASLNPSSATAAAAGGTGTIPVTAPTGCAWTAVSNVTWIAIASGASGSGNGTVGYMVAAATGAAVVRVNLFGVPGFSGQVNGVKVAHATYDYSVDGGATCTPANSDTIPDNAVVFGGVVNATAAVTAAGQPPKNR